MYVVSRLMLNSWKLISCVIVAVTILACLGLWRLSFDVSPNDVFMSDNATSKQLEQLYEDFGHEDNEIVIVLEGESLFDPDGLEKLRQYRDQLDQLPAIQGVSSLFDLRDRKTGRLLVPKYLHPQFDLEKLKRQVTQHPIGKNQLVSQDGSMLVFVARVAGKALPLSTLSDAVDEVQKVSDRYESQTGNKPLLAGHLVIRAETLESLRSSMMSGSLLATLISAFVALILFRGIWPVLICCAAPALGVLWTLGAMGWTGQQIGALGTVIPTLVMVIGLSDAVHLLLETKRQLVIGKTRHEAMMQMLCRTGPACLLTSLTTVIGFGSLLISQTQSVQQFGLCAALGSSFALLADLLVLPILVRCIEPKRIIGMQVQNESTASAWTIWVARFSLRHAKMLAAFGLVISLALLVPAFQQEPDIIWTETLPGNSDARRALQRADAVMGGALRAHIVVQWPKERKLTDRQTLRVVGEVHHAVLQTHGVSGPFSVLNVMDTIPIKSLEDRYRQAQRLAGARMARLVNDDSHRLVVTAQVPNDGAATLEHHLKPLEARIAKIEKRHQGYSIHVTGTVVAAARNMRSFIGNLGMSLAVASGIIFVVLALAFRSLRLGLISIIPNALPLLVTAAGLVLLGYPLQITSALTFSLCLGLAVDDTIHVMMRYRQLAEGMDRSCDDSAEPPCPAGKPGHEWAIRETIYQVGPALGITTAILVSGFAAMLISPMPGIQMFSLLGCIILLTAFVGDLIVLPAMLLVFGQSFQSTRRA